MPNSFMSYFSRDTNLPVESYQCGTKKTKIVATLGPTSNTEAVLRDMFNSGMNVARLNMSHGSHDDHAQSLALVHKLSAELNRPVAVLADLQGPKIRTGRLADPSVNLIAGQKICITVDDCPAGDAVRVGTTYPGLAKDVSEGTIMLIDDGKLRLVVQTIDGNDIHCIIEVGGILKNNKGINLPNASVSAPPLSDKDKADLKWALQNDVDYIALSFVRDAQDVQNIKRRIREAGKHIPVIAKIERPEAVHGIESILAVTDGIMVARGDLGIEINTERLPVVQKHLIQRANAHGRFVITATQMLESMIESPIPTRAETSDVANAIFDGTDAIMLSGETASGAHPVAAVAEMTRIAIEAENSPFAPQIHLEKSLSHFDEMDYAMGASAQFLASEVSGHAVMTFSHGCEKAQLLSKIRSPFAYICVCYDKTTWRSMALFWGVIPLMVDYTDEQQDLLERGIEEATSENLIQPNSEQKIVVLMGFGATAANSLKVITA